MHFHTPLSQTTTCHCNYSCAILEIHHILLLWPVTCSIQWEDDMCYTISIDCPLILNTTTLLKCAAMDTRHNMLTAKFNRSNCKINTSLQQWQNSQLQKMYHPWAWVLKHILLFRLLALTEKAVQSEMVSGHIACNSFPVVFRTIQITVNPLHFLGWWEGIKMFE